MAIIVPIIAKFIDDGLKDAQKGFSEANGFMKKTASVMDSLAGPAKAVVAGMAGAALSVAKNAGGAAKANKKLASSFTAIGYEKNTAAAIAYAEGLQHVIGVSDEEIQSVMQKLAAFDKVGKSQDAMARATQAAADMSAAGFSTMEGAATALGKALQNPEKNMGALTRMGVDFTKEQQKVITKMARTGDEAGAMDAILQEVEGTFGGVAEASASGTAKMKLQWDEAAEAIGTALAPMLGKLVELLRRAAVWVTENAEKVRDMAGAITLAASVILVLNAGFKAYAAVMGIAKKMTVLWGISMKVAMGWIGLVIGLVVAAAVLIVKNWDKVKSATVAVWDWIGGFLAKAWGNIKKTADMIWDGILKIIDVAWRIIKGILSLNPFVFILKHCEWAQDLMRKAWETIKSIIKAAWGAIKGLFSSNPFTAIQGWLTTLKNWIGDAFDWIKDKISGVWDFVSGIVDSIGRAVDKAKDAVSSIPIIGKRAGKRAATDSTVSAFATESARTMAGGVPVPQAQSVASRSGGGGGPVININGALDPDAVGRQIKRLLENQDVRQGRVRGAPRRVAW